MFVVLFFWSAGALADTYAIVSLNNTLPPLKSSQIKMIYRGRLSHIGTDNVTLLDLPQGSALRDAFYYSLLGKSPSQMQGIWARQTFSGRAKAPFELKSNSIEAVMSWLRHNKNGIAYIPASWLNKYVNVIYVLESEDPQ